MNKRNKAGGYMGKDKMKKDVEGNDKKNPGFFSKVILIWMLPILYSIGLGMTILHFAGISLPTQIKWIDKHTEQVFKQKEKSKIDVASTKDKTDDSIDQNTEEQLNNKPSEPDLIEKNDPSVDEASPIENEATNAVVETFMDLESRDAAKLIMNMSEADALMVLRELSADVRSSIIAELPDDAGARFTIAIVNGTDIETTTRSTSQIYKYMKADQIATVLTGINNREEILRQIKNLDPQKASEVISQLEPEIAGWIITRMN
jgi:flagellar motility protein MotE (MotC chaperone)